MTFRGGRELVLCPFSESLINDEDFALMYDLNTSKNQHFQYWECNPLDLDAILKMMLMQILGFRKMTLEDWEKQ